MIIKVQDGWSFVADRILVNCYLISQEFLNAKVIFMIIGRWVFLILKGRYMPAGAGKMQEFMSKVHATGILWNNPAYSGILWHFLKKIII